MIPNLSTILDPLRQYRYSITIGMLCLFLAPMVMPPTWVAYMNVGAVWQYVSAGFFFISVAMIMTRDVWPWISRKFGWSAGRIDKEKYAKAVLQECREQGGDPPFEIDLEKEFEGDDIDETLLLDFLRAVTETDEKITLQGTKIIVTEAGLQTLKSYL